MLEAHDLAGQRGMTMLFTGLAFRLVAGDALMVTGANGTGKTTLLRILAGLTAPSAGEVRWQGARVSPFGSAMRNAVVYVGHSTALKDELTPEENLASLVALAGARVSTRMIGDALDEADLGAQRALPARVLSAGQRRRVGLARLRLLPRPLWVLDEPATALDAAGGALLRTILERHLAGGGVAVAATHQSLDLPSSRTQTLSLRKGALREAGNHGG